jgi:hypothetical protein
LPDALKSYMDGRLAAFEQTARQVVESGDEWLD